MVEVVRIAEELRALMRTVKRWQRTWGLDRTGLVFCIGQARPWPGAVLAGMLANDWDVQVVAPPPGDPEDGFDAAIDIALAAFAAPRSVTLLTPVMLESGKLEDLRARRERIAMMRAGLQAESLRNERLEAELKREFERMDRRHLEVLNKQIARLDTLIDLRTRGV